MKTFYQHFMILFCLACCCYSLRNVSIALENYSQSLNELSTIVKHDKGVDYIMPTNLKDRSELTFQIRINLKPEQHFILTRLLEGHLTQTGVGGWSDGRTWADYDFSEKKK